MAPILGILVLLLLVFGPALWVRAVLAWNGDQRSDFPGTGGELARHLLDQGGLAHIKVEVTKQGDHYDPEDKAVRLKKEHHEGRSLTAVAVAAHEVGHAFQDRDDYGPLKTRSRLIKSTRVFERLGSVVIFATGALAMVTRSPVVLLAGGLAGIATMGLSVIVHLVTLPVESDASFNRALPALDKGRYLAEADMPAARRILKACAFTYVSASLAALLNLWRWIRFIR
jgi:Zn-dependent membrane protease YugP